MISNEIGAGMPMTGDYDLFAVCPSWAQYGSLTATPIVKPGIALMDGSLQKGLSFPAGVGMDNVMDPRLQTMGKTGGVTKDFTARQADMRAKMAAGSTGQLSADSLKNYLEATPWMEHGDMGNLTPRILRCINGLNSQMGAVGANAALRRVHHNAPSLIATASSARSPGRTW
jgi:hypothetical protein